MSSSRQGAGSVAARAAAEAALLVATVARETTGWGGAAGAVAQANALADRLIELAAEDAEAFAAALEALEASSRDLPMRLAHAAEVPLEIARKAADVAEAAALVAERCDGTFRADAVSAALLAEAAVRCAATLLARNLTVGEGSERLKRARRLTDTAATASRHALETEP